jgi:hypothetical protein
MLKNGQVTIGTTPTLITTGVVGASWVSLHMSGNTTVYVGDAAVTTSTGMELHKGVTVTIWLPEADKLYGVVASSTQVLTYLHTGGR